MWPFDKKEETYIPPIDFNPLYDKGLEIEFTTIWRQEKKEVEIFTERGIIVLNENSEFFVEISRKNFNPIKIQIVPDFNTRRLNFLEVLDPNLKIDENKGMISFSSSVKHLDIDTMLPIKNVDREFSIIEDKIKRYKKLNKIFIFVGTISILSNVYLSFVMSGTYRYVSLLIILCSIYLIYMTIEKNRKMMNNYNEVKTIRDNICGIAKDR